MENLNDVEFGSNRGTEEAPILVAQRYLNIFRQIHIFNKDMRTKFDDELLALAPNITDFFKRLPGGRLLVEHIEDVKTERGISFEKANREDFSNGLDDNVPSAPSTYAAPVPTQITGGNLTIDESFAESLAQSMANAFKQLPSSPVSSGGATISGDFGQAFELIAEEIRSSRASLLDVLKETRNITDSVIASQVSISRILEGILSSRQHEENDTTSLNNRIIASQASITKLLEGLYTASTQKNAEISDYLNVDNKLQDFRDNISQKITEILSALAQKNSSADTSINIENRLSAFRNEIKTDVNQSLSEIRQLLFNYMQNNTTNINQKSEPSVYTQRNKVVTQPMQTNSSVNEQMNDSLLNDETRKKKKKKKKKNGETFNASDFTGSSAFTGGTTARNKAVLDEDDNDFDADDDNGIAADDLTSFVHEENVAPIDGVIRNSEYKHEDDFSNVNLNMPPLDETPENVHEEITDNSELNTDDFSDLDNSLDNLDFGIPEETSSPLDEPLNISSNTQNQSQEDKNSLDFANSTVTKVPTDSSLDDFGSLDNFTDDLDSPNQSIEDSSINLDETVPDLDITSKDTIDNNINFDNTFADATSSAEDTENRFENTLDEVTEQPEDNILSDMPIEQVNSLDTFDDRDDDFVEETDTKSDKDSNDLDSFGSLHVGSLDDFANTQPLPIETLRDDEEKPLVSNDDTYETLDDEAENDNSPQIQQSESREQSRYSAELDKIRQALTSDNVDISSLDEPIALDDYSDDENVAEDDEPVPQTSADDNQEWEYEYVEDDGTENTNNSTDTSSQDVQGQNDGEDWEWEYVDENGQAASVPENKENEEDWEWEYVEDDGSSSGNDNENNNQ